MFKYLLLKYKLTVEEISTYHSRISNIYCTIDFYKERYEEGFVVVLTTPFHRINFAEFLRSKTDIEILKNLSSNHFETIAVAVIKNCDEILNGNYDSNNLPTQ